MIVFVILYYRAYKDTVECIDSILAFDEPRENYKVIVVDNGSNDGSFERITEYFKSNDIIETVSTNSNLGYAKGNNFGIKYAKQKYSPEYLVIVNSDVVFNHRNFCKSIKEIYLKEKYYILGPAVKGYYDGLDQSPILLKDDESLHYQFFRNILRIIAWGTGFIPYIKHPKPNTINISIPNENEIYTCVCQGSCLVFSKDFLQKWSGFDPNTFLYREEVILFYIMHRLDCKTIFSGSVEVLHKGQTSTIIKYGDNERKRHVKQLININRSMREEMRVFKMTNEELDILLR